MNEDKVLNKTEVINSIREKITFISRNLVDDITIFQMDEDKLDILDFYLDIIVNNIKYTKKED